MGTHTDLQSCTILSLYKMPFGRVTLSGDMEQDFGIQNLKKQLSAKRNSYHELF